MEFPRESGVLLHPTSLPGPHGMGDMGPAAYAFADALVEMGQHLWQILPLGVTGYGDSPYQSFSTFAGNPLWISFELLVADGFLAKAHLAKFPSFPADHVDYGSVIPARREILASVCRSFDRRATLQQKAAFHEFCDNNASWLEDYALFMALKEAHDLQPWTTWEPELLRRDPAALKAARSTYRVAVRNAKLQQYLFDDQWQRLRGYCRARNIRIVGDIPIFVAHDSADAWANPELYYLRENGMPLVVAGVPPDYFSATGQLWGNPLYRWDVHAQTGYAWWIQRMRKIFEMVDIVRIDHFRGFEAYWEIPGDAATAVNGHWVKGPEAALFVALEQALGKVPVIAEDLGIITRPVEELRDRFHFPGMRVLQFAFGNDDKADDYKPHSYPRNCVVYTGTHDNDTTVGWFHSQAGVGSTRSQHDIDRERRTILDYLHSDGREIQWDLIGLALRSNANTAVVPLQDVLGLGSEARMNTPGIPGGNWRWRFSWDQLTPQLKRRLHDVAAQSGRIHA